MLKTVKTRVRLLNVTIDYLVIVFLSGLIYGFVYQPYLAFTNQMDTSILVPSSLTGGYINKADKLYQVVLLLSIFFYYFIFECLTDKTIGKMITRTKVVNMNDENPTTYDYFIRTIIRTIPNLNLFDAVSFLNTDITGLHDRVSKTKLIKY
jgi:uncharacterized RDD family membrane protein YckC